VCAGGVEASGGGRGERWWRARTVGAEGGGGGAVEIQMVLGWAGMGSATEERRTGVVGGGRAAVSGDETGEQVGKVRSSSTRR